MDSLKELFRAMGFKNVSTYIQSGNVVFQSAKKDPILLSKNIEKKILEDILEILMNYFYKLLPDEMVFCLWYFVGYCITSCFFQTFLILKSKKQNDHTDDTNEKNDNKNYDNKECNSKHHDDKNIDNKQHDDKQDNDKQVHDKQDHDKKYQK